MSLSKFALLLIGSLFMVGSASADSIIEQMIAEGPSVKTCNSFALAYADGIYRYGEGAETIADVEPHPQIDDVLDMRLWRELQEAGLKQIKLMYTAAVETGNTIAERQDLMDTAKAVYAELERQCNATRDLTPVKLLPNLSEFTLDVIHRIEVGRTI